MLKLFGPNFPIMILKHWKVLFLLIFKQYREQTIFKIKELSTPDPTNHEILLNNLETIPTKVDCTYDI